MKIFSFKKQKNENSRDRNDQLYSRYLFKFHEELAMEHEFDLEKSRLVADYKDSQKTSFAIVDENHQIYKVEGKKVTKHKITTISNSPNPSDTDYTISFGFPYLRICNSQNFNILVEKSGLVKFIRITDGDEKRPCSFIYDKITSIAHTITKPEELFILTEGNNLRLYKISDRLCNCTQ